MPSGYLIGIISDTHGLLRPEVTEALRGCDAILHGGDINSREILKRLEQIAPVYAVRGNNDKEWAQPLPETLTVTLGGLTFFMIHNRKMIPQDVGGADVVVYGHTHRYEEQCEGGRLYLNPGSCGPRRFVQPVTLAVMEIGADGSCRTERVDLAHKGGILGRRVTAVRSAASAGGVWTAAGKDETGRQKAAASDCAGESLAAAGKGEAGSQRTAASGRAGESPAGSASEDDAMKIPANIQDLIPLVIKDMKRGRPVAEIARRTGLSYELTEQICRLYVTHPGVDLDGILRRMGI